MATKAVRYARLSAFLSFKITCQFYNLFNLWIVELDLLKFYQLMNTEQWTQNTVISNIGSYFRSGGKFFIFDSITVWKCLYFNENLTRRPLVTDFKILKILSNFKSRIVQFLTTVILFLCNSMVATKAMVCPTFSLFKIRQFVLFNFMNAWLFVELDQSGLLVTFLPVNV